VFLPAGVQAQVHDVQPRVVSLHFAVQVHRVVPVVSRVVLLPSFSGRVTDSPALRIDPESVVVAGDRDRVERIRSVPTASVTLQAASGTTASVALDLSGLDGVRVSPSRVRVVFPPAPPPAPATQSADTTRRDTPRAAPVPDESRW
jgi:hypothetical protein